MARRGIAGRRPVARAVRLNLIASEEVQALTVEEAVSMLAALDAKLQTPEYEGHPYVFALRQAVAERIAELTSQVQA